MVQPQLQFSPLQPLPHTVLSPNPKHSPLLATLKKLTVPQPKQHGYLLTWFTQVSSQVSKHDFCVWRWRIPWDSHTSWWLTNWLLPPPQPWQSGARQRLHLCLTTVLHLSNLFSQPPLQPPCLSWRDYRTGSCVCFPWYFPSHKHMPGISPSPAEGACKDGLPPSVPWHNVCEQFSCHCCLVSSGFRTLSAPWGLWTSCTSIFVSKCSNYEWMVAQGH